MTPALLSPGARAEITSSYGARLQVHWWEVRDFVLARDQYTCQACGRQGNTKTLQVHHLMPVQYGGGSEPANLVTLCPTCHHRLHREFRTFRGRRTFEGVRT